MKASKHLKVRLLESLVVWQDKTSLGIENLLCDFCMYTLEEWTRMPLVLILEEPKYYWSRRLFHSFIDYSTLDLDGPVRNLATWCLASIILPFGLLGMLDHHCRRSGGIYSVPFPCPRRFIANSWRSFSYRPCSQLTWTCLSTIQLNRRAVWSGMRPDSYYCINLDPHRSACSEGICWVKSLVGSLQDETWCTRSW